jgi:hypothetical protein
MANSLAKAETGLRAGQKQNSVFGATQYRSKLYPSIPTVLITDDGIGGGGMTPTLPSNFVFTGLNSPVSGLFITADVTNPSVSTTISIVNGLLNTSTAPITMTPSGSQEFEIGFNIGTNNVTLSGFHSSQNTIMLSILPGLSGTLSAQTIDFTLAPFTTYNLPISEINLTNFPSFPTITTTINISLNGENNIILPSSLLSLSNLSMLNLTNSLISSFPPNFFPPSLSFLYLTDNSLSGIPNITTLTGLYELNLSNNLITQASLQSTLTNLPVITAPQSFNILDQYFITVMSSDLTTVKPRTLNIPTGITFPYRGWNLNTSSVSFFEFAVLNQTMTAYDINLEYNFAVDEYLYSYNFMFDNPSGSTKDKYYETSGYGNTVTPKITGKAYGITGILETGGIRFENVPGSLKTLKIRDVQNGGSSANQITSLTISPNFLTGITLIDIENNGINTAGLTTILNNLPIATTNPTIKILTQTTTLTNPFTSSYRGWTIA